MAMIISDAHNAARILQGQLRKAMVAMERKRTYFDDIHQDVNKIEKYASDLQTFIGVKEMTSVVEAKKKDTPLIPILKIDSRLSCELWL
jgi:uncharacterized protein (UPF0335 family)